MREVAGGALSIGLPNADVEAAVADGVIGAAEAARIAQFGEDRRRRHRADTVELPGQWTAARLPAGRSLRRPVNPRQLPGWQVRRSPAQPLSASARGGKLEAEQLVPAH